MDPILEEALRRFVGRRHLRNLLTGKWVPLFDDAGNRLAGIRGRIGVSAETVDGETVGVDLMEMRPGTEFPLHVHPGDHLLYVMSGRGEMTIGSVTAPLKTGDVTFIPGDAPHAFRCPARWNEPLRFLAFGHPHRRLNSTDRMRVVKEEPRGRTKARVVTTRRERRGR